MVAASLELSGAIFEGREHSVLDALDAVKFPPCADHLTHEKFLVRGGRREVGRVAFKQRAELVAVIVGEHGISGREAVKFMILARGGFAFGVLGPVLCLLFSWFARVWAVVAIQAPYDSRLLEAVQTFVSGRRR